MLVEELSFYVNLGLWYLKLLVLLSFPLIGYVIRRKWEYAVAKEVDVRRLMRLAAEEAARAEEEAAEARYYADVNVNRPAFGFKSEDVVEEGSFRCVPEVKVKADVGLRNDKGHKCAVCLNPTTTRCSRCKAVRYCSTKCQFFHWWDGHRDKCHPPSSIPKHSSNAGINHQSDISNKEKEVTHSYNIETENKQLNPPGTHLEGDVFCGIDLTEQQNGKNSSITTEEVKPSLSTASFSTAFSSDSSLSGVTSYSSDDASTTKSSGSSDLENSNGCQHDDTSNQAKSAIQLANEVKPCDPNGSTYVPSKPKTQLLSTQQKNQKTSCSTSSLGAERCDPLIAKSDASKFREGALDYGRSKSGKAESHAKNDFISNIESSLSCTSCLYGKIDNSCHVNGNMQGSFAMFNQPVIESVSSKKIDSSYSEAMIPDIWGSSVPKQAKYVDNSVFIVSGVCKSKDWSSTAVLSPPVEDSRGDSQRVSVPPLWSSKKVGRSNDTANHISNCRRSSASNGDVTVHKVKLDNSCQTNNISDSQRAKHSSLSAEKCGLGINASEFSKQSLKSKLIGSLPSNSHGIHIDSRGRIASPVTNIDGLKSDIKIATFDKSYLCKVEDGSKISTWNSADHFQASKPSRHHGADEREAKKGMFSYELFKSLYGWNKIEMQPCGLVNCGNSCYANAVLQCLAFTPPLTAYLLEGHHSRCCSKRDWCFTCEFENLILKVKDGKSPISPIGIISQIQNIGSHLSNGREEDAHEFLRYVVDTMQSICLKEANSKISGIPEEETTLLSLMFGGYLQSKIRCLKCGNKSERSERIMDLSVEIEGSIGSLEAALRRFTSTETLDGENKYNCERCKSYQKATKKLTILEAPNILTVALKRFQVGEFGKLNKWIDFPQILNIAPYMSGTSDDKAPVYDLYGVIVHLDTMNTAFSGHYVCYVKNIQKKWFKIDDNTVRISDFGEVKKQSAYMLFYARCLPRAPRCFRDKLISLMTRHNLVSPGSESPDIGSLTRSEFYSKRHSLKIERDLYSDNNSLFSSSDANSCSTDISTKESYKSDDLSNHIFGDSGHGFGYPFKSSSNSNSSSPSVSPF